MVAGNIFRKFYVLAGFRTSSWHVFVLGLPSSLLVCYSPGENGGQREFVKMNQRPELFGMDLFGIVTPTRGSVRQPLMTARFGHTRGCNPLVCVVFFGAYLCSDQLHASQDRTSESSQNIREPSDWDLREPQAGLPSSPRAGSAGHPTAIQLMSVHFYPIYRSSYKSTGAFQPPIAKPQCV